MLIGPRYAAQAVSQASLVGKLILIFSYPENINIHNLIMLSDQCTVSTEKPNITNIPAEHLKTTIKPASVSPRNIQH